MSSDLPVVSFSPGKALVARSEDCRIQSKEIGSPATSDSWQGCDDSDSDGGALL